MFKSVTVFVLLCHLLLSGCSTNSGRVFSLKDNIYPFENEVLTNKVPSKTVRFKEGYVSNDVLYASYMKSIVRSVENSYRMRGLPEPKIQHDGFSSTVNFLLKNAKDNNPRSERSSVRVTPKGGAIEIGFISGEYHGYRKGEAIQKATFPINRYQKNGYVYFTISYPAAYVHRKGNIGSQPAVLPLFEKHEVDDAFEYAFKSIKIEKVGYQKDTTFSGEITSKYPDDSVYANFKRRLKYGTNEKHIQKDGHLKHSIDGFDTSIGIAVFPYRNGSKVTYKAYMNREFYLTPNGKNTYKRFPAKAKVESVLLAIANE